VDQKVEEEEHKTLSIEVLLLSGGKDKSPFEKWKGTGAVAQAKGVGVKIGKEETRSLNKERRDNEVEKRGCTARKGRQGSCSSDAEV